MNLLNPNISYEEISDELLIREFNNPQKYKKRHLYALMSKRANSNLIIRKCLFELILDEQARKEIEMGFITHAWLPALFILQNSNDDVRLEVKKILKRWPKNEIEIFLNYIKTDNEYYNLLKDIL